MQRRSPEHTRIFGILADPIHHVKTPQGINRLLRERGIDGVMVPLHVGADGLATLMQGLRQHAQPDGFVVTVPHKTAVVGLCDELTTGGRAHRRGQRGAAHGRWAAVRRHARRRRASSPGCAARASSLAGCSVYLAGAGGAASAIAFALAAAGVRRLTIANRTPTRRSS